MHVGTRGDPPQKRRSKMGPSMAHKTIGAGPSHTRDTRMSVSAPDPYPYPRGGGGSHVSAKPRRLRKAPSPPPPNAPGYPLRSQAQGAPSGGGGAMRHAAAPFGSGAAQARGPARPPPQTREAGGGTHTPHTGPRPQRRGPTRTCAPLPFGGRVCTPSVTPRAPSAVVHWGRHTDTAEGEGVVGVGGRDDCVKDGADRLYGRPHKCVGAGTLFRRTPAGSGRARALLRTLLLGGGGDLRNSGLPHRSPAGPPRRKRSFKRLVDDDPSRRCESRSAPRQHGPGRCRGARAAGAVRACDAGRGRPRGGVTVPTRRLGGLGARTCGWSPFGSTAATPPPKRPGGRRGALWCAEGPEGCAPPH